VLPPFSFFDIYSPSGSVLLAQSNFSNHHEAFPIQYESNSIINLCQHSVLGPRHYDLIQTHRHRLSRRLNSRYSHHHIIHGGSSGSLPPHSLQIYTTMGVIIAITMMVLAIVLFLFGIAVFVPLLRRIFELWRDSPSSRESQQLIHSSSNDVNRPDEIVL
jgi:hypothetical protein